MGRFSPAPLWLGGLLLLLAAALCRDPYLYAVRAWAIPAVVAVGIIGAVAIVLRLRRSAMSAGLVVVWVAAPAIALVGEARFLVDSATVRSASGPAAQHLGQRFVIGYERVEQIAPLAERGLIGGIFVTRRNVEGRSANELRAEIDRLQALRRAAGLPPLVVATDQEGGMVSRLSPPLPSRPPLSALAELPPAERQAAAHAYGLAQGRELAGIGVTVNFAPVLDLADGRPGHPLDFHSLIRQRAIAAEADAVAEIALGYAHGLEAAGIIATAKHFPGLGGVVEDTHHFAGHLRASVAELDARDWRPFRRLAGDSSAWIMVGHATAVAIDPDNPASLSRRVVQGVLRRDWGFRGVLITDDLTMRAVYGRGICRAAAEALAAGVDLLLVSYDWSQYYRAMACALRRQIAEAREPD